MKKKDKTGSHSLAVVRKFFPNVKSVSDANGAAEVTVTAADERVSKKQNHDSCAMAVACKRELKVDGVIISRKTAYLIKDNKAVRYELPESVSREVVSFDRGGGFAPGEYNMRPPSKSRRLGEMRGGNGNNNGNGKPIRRQHKTANIRAVLGSKEI